MNFSQKVKKGEVSHLSYPFFNCSSSSLRRESSPTRTLLSPSAPDSNSGERPSPEMDCRSPGPAQVTPCSFSWSPSHPESLPTTFHQALNCVTLLLKHRQQLPTALLMPVRVTLRERTVGTSMVPGLFLHYDPGRKLLFCYYPQRYSNSVSGHIWTFSIIP